MTDNLDPDNLDPTPVGLPTPMSTSIASYHVHLNFDSGHAAQYYWPTEQGKDIADQFNKFPELDGMVSPFPYCGRVSGWNDGMMNIRWSSLYLFWWAAY